MKFCHISPIKHLDKVAGRSHHLTLAHLVETSKKYSSFYFNEKVNNPNTVIIQDNSAFEMYKQNRPMYPADKLIEMGRQTTADYLVMSDYPGEHIRKTVEAAEQLAPQFRNAGFGTFFVPQSEVGNIKQLIEGFLWAAKSPLVDYIGVSILAIPNAFGVEKNNKLQRYLSRRTFVLLMNEHFIDGIRYWDYLKIAGKKVHFLGMTDGPNEIELMFGLPVRIDTWDSSAAIWAGLHGIEFDYSPTGLINGKFEKEVNFNSRKNWNETVENNIQYIDLLVEEYYSI